METVRLKHVASVRVSNVDKKSVEGEEAVRLCNYTDVYYADRITADRAFMHATATESQIETFQLRKGQTLITKDSETADDIGVPAFVDTEAPDLVCGYHLAQIDPDEAKVDSRFLYWSIASGRSREQFTLGASGVTRFGLRTDTITSLEVPLPALDQQRRIATVLDGEAARIDALIAAKQRIVEASRERQRVWLSAQLGQGSSVAARRVTSLRTSGPRGWADQLSPSGSPFVRSQNLSRDSIRLRLQAVAFVDPPDSFEAQRSRTQPGDVLVGITGANTGWVGLVDDQISAAYVSQHVAILRPTVDVDPRWLAYSYFSHEGQSQLLGGQYGGTKQQLSLGELAAFELQLPRLSTQREVADAVDRSFATLAALTDTLTAQIGLLRERRQALITAAVTGEIEV